MPISSLPPLINLACRVAWGLRQVLGPNVYVLLAEPTHSPCALLGMATGLGAGVDVTDVGIDGKTEVIPRECLRALWADRHHSATRACELTIALTQARGLPLQADGLAVQRVSPLAHEVLNVLSAGAYTVDDGDMLQVRRPERKLSAACCPWSCAVR